MKTQYANQPQLPGLQITLLIAGLFAVPVVLWGDRWPWLVLLPVAIMVFLTVRSEWLRIRAANEHKNVQIMEATLADAVSTYIWSVPKDKWINIAASDSPEICNISSIDDYRTSRQVVDEDLTAVA
jgi:hypothetical protein